MHGTMSLKLFKIFGVLDEIWMGHLQKNLKRNSPCATTRSTELRDRKFSTKYVIKAVKFVTKKH